MTVGQGERVCGGATQCEEHGGGFWSSGGKTLMLGFFGGGGGEGGGGGGGGRSDQDRLPEGRGSRVGFLFVVTSVF